jgi:hypothetical protein
MEHDSEPSVLGAGSYRSVSIQPLSNDEKKMVIEAIKIARVTAIGGIIENKSLVASTLKDLLTRFQGANEVWLATSSSQSKSA